MSPGYCHPTHAMRTKCACGAVITLRGAFGSTYAKCDCGRKHRKESAPRGSFAAATGKNPKNGALTTGQRSGGKAGCPGFEALEDALDGDKSA